MRLFAEFVSGQVVSFTGGDGGCSMGVRRKVVQLCDSIVRALWHGLLLLNWMAVLWARLGSTQTS